MNTRKKLILDTAEKLFNLYGYHDVGIDLIISDSNVAKMTLYRNFASKEELIKTVLERKHTEVNDKIEKLIDENASVEDDIYRIFDYFSQWIHGSEFHGCMYTKSITEFSHKSEEIINATNLHKTSQLKIFQTMFKKIYNTQESEHLASVMLTLLDGAILAEQSGFNKEMSTLNAARDFFINSLPKTLSK